MVNNMRPKIMSHVMVLPRNVINLSIIEQSRGVDYTSLTLIGDTHLLHPLKSRNPFSIHFN